jgi:hypothetical protein
MHKVIARLIDECKRLQLEMAKTPQSTLFLRHYSSANAEYELSMSRLADILDQEDFNIDELQGHIDDLQLRWLRMNIGEIKKHLEGKEV